jgi:hypothetical protein
MELAKKCLEKFIEKIESRGGSFDREGMYATIPADNSVSMRASIRDDLHESPDYSVKLDGGPSGDGDPANVDESKVRIECNKILGEILKELEDEGC